MRWQQSLMTSMDPAIGMELDVYPVIRSACMRHQMRSRAVASVNCHMDAVKLCRADIGERLSVMKMIHLASLW